MNNQELIETLNWRYATKFFDPEKKLSTEQVKTIKEALILTPSSFGLQPYKFVIIKDLETRKKLTEFSWNQPQIENCSHLVVFQAKQEIDQEYLDDFIKLTAHTRNIPMADLNLYKEVISNSMLNPERDIPEWSMKQAYIALGNLMTAAAAIEIDTCPLEGIEPENYDKILKTTKGYKTVVACALGFRAENDKYQNLAKVRYSEEELITTL